jgi:hypothetical protein
LADRLEPLRHPPSRLTELGRFLTTTFLVEAGDQQVLVDVEHGAVVRLRPGPLVMPNWDFAIRSHREDWEQFWLPVPPPGSHDLFALLKRKRLRFDGDLGPLMANLLYVKGLLALPRQAPAGDENG